MGVYKSERRIWTDVTDLAPVVERLAAHFAAKGYEVARQQTTAGAWDVDITRTGDFRAVAGMKTALKVRIEPQPGSVLVRAGIGIWGQQAAATMISLFVFPPLLYAQIWGMIESAKVDNEAMDVIEAALGAQRGAASPPGPAPANPPPIVQAPSSQAPSVQAPSVQAPGVPAAGAAGVPQQRGAFCAECGAAVAGGKFCTSCGAKLPAAG